MMVAETGTLARYTDAIVGLCKPKEQALGALVVRK